MTNVALCITDLNAGGAERCLVEIATRIDRARFVPTVYCLKPPPEPGETSLVPELETAGVAVHFLNARGWRDFPRMVTELRRSLSDRDTQITQSFLFHANIVARFAASGVRGCRVVSGIRVAERGASWHRWADRLTQQKVDKYVCVSRSVAEFSAKIARLPAEKLAVISNGIDPQRYCNLQPANLSVLPPGRRLITFIGRLEAQKSLRDLIATARTWLARLPDCDLLIVGKGPQEAQLREQCRAAGIAERVHFLGWRADVPAILAASSLLVLASAWEGMPNVVLEAMASGLPVAATRVEGIEELLGPAIQEQSVPYGDWEGFSEMVVRIANSPDLAEKLANANRRRAIEQFSVQRMVEAYQALWQALLTG
jgi:glycosyltransferase involved in cell wall biosynthesis